MSKFNSLLLKAFVISYLCSCTNIKWQLIEESAFKQSISSGRYLSKKSLGHGSYLVFYKEHNKIDSIYISFGAVTCEDMDTFSVLRKDSLSYLIRVINLKDRDNGRRYNDYIDLKGKD